jgi:rhodanese-related sulfurtransferase
MINFLKRIFGEKVNIQELILNGATIIDVRTKVEFQRGHLNNSINIPLGNLNNSLKKLNKNKPIITCCASGARSASAKSLLKSNGFIQVHNGGSWINLKKYIQM